MGGGAPKNGTPSNLYRSACDDDDDDHHHLRTYDKLLVGY